MRRRYSPRARARAHVPPSTPRDTILASRFRAAVYSRRDFRALPARRYCAHLDNARAAVTLYRLSKDGATPAHAFHTYTTGPAALSVSDNLLAVHCLEAKVSLLYDLLAAAPPGAAAPALAPRDAFAPGLPVARAPAPAARAGDGAAAAAPAAGGGARADDGAPSAAGGGDGGSADGLYDGAWELVGARWLLDRARGRVLEIGCNLAAAVHGARDRAHVVPFLMRRGGARARDAATAHRAKALALCHACDLVVERARILRILC